MKVLLHALPAALVDSPLAPQALTETTPVLNVRLNFGFLQGGIWRVREKHFPELFWQGSRLTQLARENIEPGNGAGSTVTSCTLSSSSILGRGRNHVLEMRLG